MSAIQETIKKAEKEKTSAIISELLEQRPGSYVEIQSQKPPYLLIAMILALGVALFLFISERDLRLQREAVLATKIAELDDKQMRISALVQENTEITQSFKSKVEELEFTLKQMNDSFDMLMKERATLKIQSDEKDKKLTDLSAQVEALATDKVELISLVKAQKAELERFSSSTGTGHTR